MGKTPDEIKKGLECCSTKKPCPSCPMWDECKEAASLKPLWDNALAYIQQLEAANTELLTRCERLERERDALLEMTEKECCTCKHNFGNDQDRSCIECGGESKWQWIGV